MVLQIHMEATTEKVAELANLLDHNPDTTIIWNHAGWSNTGDATADVFSQMLADHPNLYILLKMRMYGSGQAAGDITNDDGSIKNEWLILMNAYANRIMAESDAKFWQGGEAIADELEDSYPYLDAMLDQLPSETELRIREITARTLYGL